MVTLFITMFYSLASPYTLACKTIILIRLIYTLATQVTRNSAYPLHLVTK